MQHFFNPENKFWEFMGKITDIACMSLLWVLTSIPIITMGASTTAFYEFTLNQVKDTEGSIVKSYFRSFKKHFKKASILWIVQLLGLAFFLADLWAAWNFITIKGGFAGILIFAICCFCAVVFISCCYYIYPTLAFYDFPIKKLISNSFIMAVGNLPVSITLIIMTVALFAMIYYMSGLFFFWVALFIFFSSYFIMGVFIKYTEKDEEEEKEEKDTQPSGEDEEWLV